MSAALAQSDHSGAAHLDVRSVSKLFGQARVLDSLSISVEQGEFLSLLGPSGCGKTTLLRLIAGLLPPDGGQILVGGKDITRLPAHKRNIGVVFQNYALFPHLTVAENVGFGLRAQGVPRSAIPERVTQALDLVRMRDHAAKPVTALSGGQQQRIAVARALVVRPALLLLDEPFSALDRKLREAMQVELKQLLRDVGITAIFVTHDQEEALVVSDRIAVMDAGRIEQLADPVTLYSRPASLYVLEFVGRSTRIAGRVSASSGGQVEVATPIGTLRGRGSFMAGSEVIVAIRPEAMRLGGGPDNTIAARIADVSFLGSRTQISLAGPGPRDRLMVELAGLPEAGLVPGAQVTLGFDAADALVFPAP